MQKENPPSRDGGSPCHNGGTLHLLDHLAVWSYPFDFERVRCYDPAALLIERHRTHARLTPQEIRRPLASQVLFRELQNFGPDTLTLTSFGDRHATQGPPHHIQWIVGPKQEGGTTDHFSLFARSRDSGKMVGVDIIVSIKHRCFNGLSGPQDAMTQRNNILYVSSDKSYIHFIFLSYTELTVRCTVRPC